MTDETTIRDALASLTDDFSLRGELHRTDRHHVHEVVVDGQPGVCKYALDDTDPEPLAREVATVERVGRRTDLRVPDVLGRGTRFAVFSLVEGEPYTNDHPEPRRAERLRRLGRTLAALHDVSAVWFDEFGHLRLADAREELSVDGDPDWGACWTALVDDWLARLDDTRDAALAERVRRVTDEARNQGLFDGLAPVLTHADAGPANVRFTDDEPWLLDWEGAMAFPGEYDLARVHTGFVDRPDAVEGAAFTEHLLAGYRTERSLPDGSTIRRRLYRATLLAKFVPGGVRAAREGLIDAEPERFRADLLNSIDDRLTAVEEQL